VDPTFLAMAFDVHGEARLLLIAALQVNNFEYIQAPGEADTQLIQCFKDNPKSIIVTIDADLLYYWVPGIRIMDWSKFRSGPSSASHSTRRHANEENVLTRPAPFQCAAAHYIPILEHAGHVFLVILAIRRRLEKRVRQATRERICLLTHRLPANEGKLKVFKSL